MQKTVFQTTCARLQVSFDPRKYSFLEQHDVRGQDGKVTTERVLRKPAQFENGRLELDPSKEDERWMIAALQKHAGFNAAASTGGFRMVPEADQNVIEALQSGGPMLITPEGWPADEDKEHLRRLTVYWDNSIPPPAAAAVLKSYEHVRTRLRAGGVCQQVEPEMAPKLLLGNIRNLLKALLDAGLWNPQVNQEQAD